MLHFSRWEQAATAWVVAMGMAVGVQAAELMYLPLLEVDNSNATAYAVSDDGRYVVGYTTGEANGYGYEWATRWAVADQSVQALPFLVDTADQPANGRAYGVSADGSYVVGRTTNPDGTGDVPYRWSAADGQILDLGGTGTANDVSADGQVVVGTAKQYPGWNYERAFRWNPADGYVDMLTLPRKSGDSISRSAAEAVTPDGGVIVGSSRHSSYTFAGTAGMRWTSATGMQPLADLDGGLYSSAAVDIAPDGSVIVGSATDAEGSHPVMWDDPAGAPTILSGTLAGCNTPAVQAVSAGGAVIVGGARHIHDNFWEPMIWTPAGGMQNLAEVLAGYGVDVSRFTYSMDIARDVSADGMVIVGSAMIDYASDDPRWPGRSTAWVAFLTPEAATTVTAGAAAEHHFSLTTPTGGSRDADVTLSNPTAGELEVAVVKLGQLPSDAVAGYQQLLVPGPAEQIWQLTFDGVFDEAEVVFHYDPTLLGPEVDEQLLRIFHYDGQQWVAMGTADPASHTIRVTTGRFSPFALGLVPEPATLILLGTGVALLTSRCRRLA